MKSRNDLYRFHYNEQDISSIGIHVLVKLDAALTRILAGTSDRPNFHTRIQYEYNAMAARRNNHLDLIKQCAKILPLEGKFARIGVVDAMVLSVMQRGDSSAFIWNANGKSMRQLKSKMRPYMSGGGLTVSKILFEMAWPAFQDDFEAFRGVFCLG